ncbi:hypothetical protein [Pseudescherichia vulneris]|uniref:hypothetical protein n=1 Tax=Pseudescherichia vulneris TaxID=566 RepID=UPI0028D6963C|nr:hypothetical protein [Pseudescherichia vulneris]
MDISFKANIIPLVSAAVALVSLFVATRSLAQSKLSARLASYNARGSYDVFLTKDSRFKRYFGNANHQVKIYSSLMSGTIDFDYEINIVAKNGGIYRAQLFENIEKREYIGIGTTGPALRPSIPKHSPPKQYANQGRVSFYGTPLFPYFSAAGREGDANEQDAIQLNRYHQYIEITDFCGNTEMWYLAFSLHLSNQEGDFNKAHGWRALAKNSTPYKYYRFSDATIVSPKDLLKNLDAALTPQQTLEEIRGSEESWQPSAQLSEDGWEAMNNKLKLYEMREYYHFMRRIKENLA